MTTTAPADARTPVAVDPMAVVRQRLGAYALPGRVKDPRLAIGQATTAEHLGLGTIWLSERWGTKDLGVLAGAIGHATKQIKFASGISHFQTRHPAILASMAMTAQALSEGRVVLGFGRSVGPMWKAVGLPEATNQVLVDSADMFRRLCRGEKVSYDGPAGRFPAMRLGDLPDVAPPPLVMAAIGPKSLALAGTHFDGVILHPFLTPEAVGRQARAVRDAAEQAGRDPASVRVYATVVTAADLPQREEIEIVGSRAVTYFQIPTFGDVLAKANGWDVSALEKLRTHPLLASVRGSADNVFTRDQLRDVSEALPSEWLSSASATGSAQSCATKWHEYLDAGADELVLHGSPPELLGPTVAHFAQQLRS
ncbi:MAG: putative Coenzyme F420-dependent N(10)-methylenetetrahydromethanopterin reductase [Mycobacterium sp.]|jgi:5,10-methylenetetrahydromethanopterin reductase|nr:putative Coenzyme F420-dependent N(10)-methylenetetrahydromethanopterin reductase [Mycobacterium sp.]